MGTYIDKGNSDFSQMLNSIYVDKTGLISLVNGTLFTEQRRSCVTRSRRFGKSMAANMLCAYYDRSCDSRSLFENLEIYNDPSFEKGNDIQFGPIGHKITLLSNMGKVYRFLL